MNSQVFEVRGERFFVCEYTGAPLEKRYFVPAGRNLREKIGCFASLPIALRAVYEQEGGMTETWEDVKRRVEAYFKQPNVPMQPKLDLAKVPLSKDQLIDYLLEMDMGMAWLQVPGAQSLAEAEQEKKRKRPKKRN